MGDETGFGFKVTFEQVTCGGNALKVNKICVLVWSVGRLHGPHLSSNIMDNVGVDCSCIEWLECRSKGNQSV